MLTTSTGTEPSISHEYRAKIDKELLERQMQFADCFVMFLIPPLSSPDQAAHCGLACYARRFVFIYLFIGFVVETF